MAYFTTLKPRVIIIRRGDEFNPIFNTIYNFLITTDIKQNLYYKPLKDFFSSIIILYLETPKASFITQFKNLKEFFWDQKNNIFYIYQEFKYLFSIEYIRHLFRNTVAYTTILLN